ncbi:MAG: hypothetical protein JSS12_07475, partial [Verrucomicrobia bacterium]|nr:hypothetical protein [Verrucomicrobiota bacterium]
MIVSSDYPDNSLVEQLSNLSLDNVQDLLQKSLAEKWKIAQNLAGQLSIIHTAGFVHRFLDLNIVSKGPVDSYVFEIDEVVREEDVRAERGTYGANLKTIPPERRVYPFFGDWYKGDIYAMGTIFLQLGGLNLEGVDQSMVDFSAEHAQHMCTQDPLPQVQLLAKLGFWMMHSDPAKRPASMQEVCAFLYSREVTALPQLSAYPDTVVQDQKVDERICALVNSKLKRDKKLIKLAPMVAKIVSTATTGFFRLKKPDLKIFYFHEHTCVVFLPKMKRKGGAFKNSRVPKILYLVEGGSLLADWHAL